MHDYVIQKKVLFLEYFRVGTETARKFEIFFLNHWDLKKKYINIS
jgi:hypothetical protein